jgi:3' terminal RNA ribose 2'-O-methyltransferase Hen1
LSVAIAQVFGSALAGRSKDRPELVDTQLPFEVSISVLPCRGGEQFLRKLFEPLGYAVVAERYPLDERFPEWGDSPYYTVSLSGSVRLQELLTHIYVLVPVLDNEKHYWVGDDEVEKLLRHGEGWLAQHPEKQAVATRYLKYRRSLAREALARLIQEETIDPDMVEETRDNEEKAIERRISLNEQRVSAVIAALKSSDSKRVVDLGCGEGSLIRVLLEDREFEEIVGVDVSHRALERAQERLRIERMPSKVKERIKLIHGSLTYRDKRLSGFDAATAIEVIEHLDEARLATFERVLFEFARPSTVVLTTPNMEYNVRFEGLPAGSFRHKDHRFEWTRSEFQSWAAGVAERFGYSVRFQSVGAEDPTLGAPTQMGIFARR